MKHMFMESNKEFYLIYPRVLWQEVDEELRAKGSQLRSFTDFISHFLQYQFVEKWQLKKNHILKTFLLQWQRIFKNVYLPVAVSFAWNTQISLENGNFDYFFKCYLPLFPAII